MEAAADFYSNMFFCNGQHIAGNGLGLLLLQLARKKKKKTTIRYAFGRTNLFRDCLSVDLVFVLQRTQKGMIPHRPSARVIRWVRPKIFWQKKLFQRHNERSKRFRAQRFVFQTARTRPSASTITELLVPEYNSAIYLLFLVPAFCLFRETVAGRKKMGQEN